MLSPSISRQNNSHVYQPRQVRGFLLKGTALEGGWGGGNCYTSFSPVTRRIDTRKEQLCSPERVWSCECRGLHSSRQYKQLLKTMTTINTDYNNTELLDQELSFDELQEINGSCGAALCDGNTAETYRQLVLRRHHQTKGRLAERLADEIDLRKNDYNTRNKLSSLLSILRNRGDGTLHSRYIYWLLTIILCPQA